MIADTCRVTGTPPPPPRLPPPPPPPASSSSFFLLLRLLPPCFHHIWRKVLLHSLCRFLVIVVDSACVLQCSVSKTGSDGKKKEEKTQPRRTFFIPEKERERERELNSLETSLFLSVLARLPSWEPRPETQRQKTKLIYFIIIFFFFIFIFFFFLSFVPPKLEQQQQQQQQRQRQRRQKKRSGKKKRKEIRMGKEGRKDWIQRTNQGADRASSLRDATEWQPMGVRENGIDSESQVLAFRAKSSLPWRRTDTKSSSFFFFGFSSRSANGRQQPQSMASPECQTLMQQCGDELGLLLHGSSSSSSSTSASSTPSPRPAPVLEPVCGTDGRTYSSRCELQRARCEGHPIRVHNVGSCRNGKQNQKKKKHQKETKGNPEDRSEFVCFLLTKKTLFFCSTKPGRLVKRNEQSGPFKRHSINPLPLGFFLGGGSPFFYTHTHTK